MYTANEESGDEMIESHPASEVLYAAADALHAAEDNVAFDLLSDSLSGYIVEENLKFILSDASISLGSSIVGNNVRIAIADKSISPQNRKEKLEHVRSLLLIFADDGVEGEFDYNEAIQVLEVRLNNSSSLNELFADVEKLRAAEIGASPLM